MKGNELDFSFSGLKTAVLRWVQQHDMGSEVEARRELLRREPAPATEAWLNITPKATLNLIASFQHAVIEELMRRASAAASSIHAQAVIISGGVASNAGLRRAAEAQRNFAFYFPTAALSTDNAAMIAAAAFPKLERGELSGLDLRAQANLALA